MRDAWKRAVGAPQLGLAGLLLLLSLACASASAPVTPAPWQLLNKYIYYYVWL